MPITIDMMKAAAAQGLSIVCASCERYWEAREKGVVGDRCSSVFTCGSPLVDRTFPEYRGLMTEESFGRFCFVCGADAVLTVRKRLTLRKIGLCAEHVTWLKEQRGDITAIPMPRLDKPEPNYLGIDPKELQGHRLPREGSLLGAMLKTEKEWADRYGWEFSPLTLLGVKKERDGDGESSG